LKSYRESYSLAKPFISIIRLIQNIQNNKIAVIYLSARSFHYYCLTKKWLSNNKISNKNLILVNKAEEKIPYLNYFKDKKVILFDDLSYNQENHHVKFYTTVLEYVKNNKHIIHVDYSLLLELQNENNFDLEDFLEQIIEKAYLKYNK